MSAWRIAIRWLVGTSAGFLLFGITSPLFVRTYSTLRFDPLRETLVLEPGLDYRWRSEGYATTRIGPLGMPGRVGLPACLRDRDLGQSRAAVGFRRTAGTEHGKLALHVALWGDSQVEGASLQDRDKLFAQIQREYTRLRPVRNERKISVRPFLPGTGPSGASHKRGRTLVSAPMLTRSTPRDLSSAEVFPLARSGESAADWLSQIPRVDAALRIDAHVILIVDLSDLVSAESVAAASRPIVTGSKGDSTRLVGSADPAGLSSPPVKAGRRAIADVWPAFLIQAGKNLLLSPDGTGRRRLRFRPGPVRNGVASDAPVGTINRSADGVTGTDWRNVFAAIRRSTERPVVVIYAPNVAEIVDGGWSNLESDLNEVPAIESAAESSGVVWIDVTDALREAARRGRWPNGFHNGRIGAGHLNSVGMGIIASAAAARLDAMQIDPNQAEGRDVGRVESGRVEATLAPRPKAGR